MAIHLSRVPSNKTYILPCVKSELYLSDNYINFIEKIYCSQIIPAIFETTIFENQGRQVNILNLLYDFKVDQGFIIKEKSQLPGAALHGPGSDSQSMKNRVEPRALERRHLKAGCAFLPRPTALSKP
jgi:hypothetical protein